MTTIAFIDDYAPLRILLAEKLESLYGYTIYQYNSGIDFTARFPAENYSPALILMDISMPILNGYDTTKWIKINYPTIPVLIFSDLDLPQSMVHIVLCGADGYTSKHLCCEPNHLHNVMIKLLKERNYYDNPELYHSTKKRLAIDKCLKGVKSLTEQEMKIFKTVNLNRTHQQSAEILNTSPHTYENHLKSIYKKMGLGTVKALYKYATSVGLIKE